MLFIVQWKMWTLTLMTLTFILLIGPRACDPSCMVTDPIVGDYIPGSHCWGAGPEMCQQRKYMCISITIVLYYRIHCKFMQTLFSVEQIFECYLQVVIYGILNMKMFIVIFQN